MCEDPKDTIVAAQQQCCHCLLKLLYMLCVAVLGSLSSKTSGVEVMQTARNCRVT